MTPGVRLWAEKTLRTLPDGDVLEIGALDVNGGVADLLNGGHRYVGLDKMAGPGVDVVFDAACFIADDAWDSILVFDALEHDPCWWTTAAAITRGLRAGGLAIISVPDFGYPLHHAPDYYRWSAMGAAEMLTPLNLASLELIKEMVTDEADRDIVLRHHVAVWEKEPTNGT